MLSGSDASMRSQALEGIQKYYNELGADIEVFSGTDAPELWFQSGFVLPLFSDHRLIIVRNIARSDPKDILNSKKSGDSPFHLWINDLPDSTILVLVADEELGDSSRQYTLAKTLKTWEDAIKSTKQGQVFKFEIDLSKTPDLIRKHAKAKGYSISSKATNTLAQMVGGKPASALAELEKVMLFVEAGTEIQESDIQKVAIPDLEYNVFHLVDAIVAGQSSQMMVQVQTLVNHGSDFQAQILGRIYPLLLSNFRLIWQARFCLDSQCDPSRPTDDVKQHLPEKPIYKEPEWKVRKLTSHAKRMNLEKLTVCMKILRDSEGNLKGQGSSFTPMESLEQALLSMCLACQ